MSTLLVDRKKYETAPNQQHNTIYYLIHILCPGYWKISYTICVTIKASKAIRHLIAIRFCDKSHIRQMMAVLMRHSAT